MIDSFYEQCKRCEYENTETCIETSDCVHSCFTPKTMFGKIIDSLDNGVQPPIPDGKSDEGMVKR